MNRLCKRTIKSKPLNVIRAKDIFRYCDHIFLAQKGPNKNLPVMNINVEKGLF